MSTTDKRSLFNAGSTPLTVSVHALVVVLRLVAPRSHTLLLLAEMRMITLHPPPIHKDVDSLD